MTPLLLLLLWLFICLYLFVYLFVVINYNWLIGNAVLCVGWSKNLDSSSMWSTLKRKRWLESGKRLRSTSLDSQKWMTIGTPWKYSLRLGSRSISKPWTGLFSHYFIHLFLSPFFFPKKKKLSQFSCYFVN